MMNDDDNYYPEGIDKAEFDAMVAEEMARLEFETRLSMKKQNHSYSDDGDMLHRNDLYHEPVVAPIRKTPESCTVRPQQTQREVKRAQQQEYARQLQIDSTRNSAISSNRDTNGVLRSGRPSSDTSRRPIVEEERRRKDTLNMPIVNDYAAGSKIAEKTGLDIFGNASILSHRSPSKIAITDDQKAKIDRQREYARALDEDKYNKEFQQRNNISMNVNQTKVNVGRNRQATPEASNAARNPNQSTNMTKAEKH